MKSDKSTVAVVAYVATPHQGYISFFETYRGAVLYVLGDDLLAEHVSLLRHLPGNTPEAVARMVTALHIFADVMVLHRDTMDLLSRHDRIVMPDEDVSRRVAAEFCLDRDVEFDGSWKLRWHWDAVQHKQQVHDVSCVTLNELDQHFMRLAYVEAQRSPDWWRQIGALLVQEGVPLLAAYNTHYPSEQSAYVYGDPRSQFDPGISIEVSSALHSEIAVIAEAARRGVSTVGCDLYVTTFPCPPCAYAVGRAGIRRLYFAEGYSRLEGKAALESQGVDIVRVQLTPPSQ